MEKLSVALFGEAERGEYERPHFCTSVSQLMDYCGNPPPDSKGLHYAIQALLYDRFLLFFRVREEGYSQKDYMQGLQFLTVNKLITQVTAICVPGVGDVGIIDAITPYCRSNQLILIISESDLYDYLTCRNV